MRLLLLSAHYRQPLDWSETALHQAQANLDRLYGLLRDHPPASEAETAPDEEIVTALEDDLNTPAALAALNVLGRRISDAAEDEKPLLAARLKASASLLEIGRASCREGGEG